MINVIRKYLRFGINYWLSLRRLYLVGNVLKMYEIKKLFRIKKRCGIKRVNDFGAGVNPYG